MDSRNPEYSILLTLLALRQTILKDARQELASAVVKPCAGCLGKEYPEQAFDPT
jgi:hypothetical protein